MRYLKKFNESISKEYLQDFCESVLAYLMDEGFTVSIMCGDAYTFTIFLQKEAREFFKWDEVKDYYIPFLQLLSNRYDIGTFVTEASESSVRFRYRQKKDSSIYPYDSFVNTNKDFSYARVINDDIFDSEGYWKDHIYYETNHKWIPDPDLIYLGVTIKVKNNQIDEK